MKIAILSRNFSRVAGGAESYAVQLAYAMQKDGDITVISQTFDEPASAFKHIAVPKLPFKSRWINQLWFNWYSQKVSSTGFDIVHSHENVTHGNVQTVHVKTVHASLAQKGMSRFRIYLSPRLPAYLWLENKRLCTKGHQNIFVSQLLLDETRKYLPELSSGVFIPPGVSFPEHDITPEDKAQAKIKLGLKPAVMALGFVAHDFKKKGLDVLLKAIKQLPFDVQLVVIGNPVQAPRYKEAVRDLGPGKSCLFMGLTRDMALAYSALDCLAHPTTQDVFPMSLLEAMAYSLPVITTMPPYNTMASLLTHGVDSLLIPDPNDHASLACAISQVGLDVNLRQQLISHGRLFAEKYSWSGVKTRYFAIYRALMDEAAKPSVIQ